MNVSALIWILVAAGVVTLLVALLRQSAPKRRARAVRDLLDAADALEARLRTARAEIEAVAGERGQDPIREAMREMLRQRLWLREHGREASLEQLAEVRTSIDAARNRIETAARRRSSAPAPRWPDPPGPAHAAALILASTSRYRRELLARLRLPFETARPEVDEAALPGETPLALAAAPGRGQGGRDRGARTQGPG